MEEELLLAPWHLLILALIRGGTPCSYQQNSDVSRLLWYGLSVEDSKLLSRWRSNLTEFCTNWMRRMIRGPTGLNWGNPWGICPQNGSIQQDSNLDCPINPIILSPNLIEHVKAKWFMSHFQQVNLIHMLHVLVWSCFLLDKNIFQCCLWLINKF